MATKVQLAGGAFQDTSGNVLAGGYLLLELSQDAQVNGSMEVCAGNKIRVGLDGNGNVQSTSAAMWPNDQMLPVNTFYNVSAFTAQGQLVWGPNAQQVLTPIGTATTFNLGTWIPGAVNVLVPPSTPKLVVSSSVTALTATGGPQTLPTGPVGFVTITINGTDYKLPYYGI